jgi:cbb3-type cytochrome oxidase subunit 3
MLKALFALVLVLAFVAGPWFALRQVRSRDAGRGNKR